MPGDRRGQRAAAPARHRAAVGKWTFPGGYVDFGENAAEAAVRETREEVGMRVALGPLLGVFNDPDRSLWWFILRNPA